MYQDYKQWRIVNPYQDNLLLLEYIFHLLLLEDDWIVMKRPDM